MNHALFLKMEFCNRIYILSPRLFHRMFFEQKEIRIKLSIFVCLFSE